MTDHHGSRAATADAALLDAAKPPRSRNNILSFCFFNPRNGPEPTLEPVHQNNSRFSVSSKQDDRAADQAPDWDRPRLGHQQEPSCCVVAVTREGFCGRGAAAGRHSQHEVLLPAWLVSTHGDGGTLHILHLQSHVGVEFVCKEKKREEEQFRVSVVTSCFQPASSK